MVTGVQRLPTRIATALLSLLLRRRLLRLLPQRLLRPQSLPRPLHQRPWLRPPRLPLHRLRL